MTRSGFDEAFDVLESGREQGLHDGAQLYVSRAGETLVDAAVGESRPGRALRTDDLMLWYSSGKPLTTAAILHLVERGRLGLDDHVGDYVVRWRAGKEACTVRHVLVHTGGFTMFADELFDRDLTYAEAVARIAAHPAEWEPGTAAGYHPSSGGKILGAIVERIDGRPIQQYVAEEICAPIGMTDTYIGIPTDVQLELGERIVPVRSTGHTVLQSVDGAYQMVPYPVEEVHNKPWHIAKVEPGGTSRGPARELGRFYESLLGFGPPIVNAESFELMSTVQRHGVRDRLLMNDAPWGLGTQVAFSGGTSSRVFGHGGMASSRGIADVELGVVMVVVCNGLPAYFGNENRMSKVTDAVYRALGDDVQDRRRPPVSLAAQLGALST